MSVDENKTRTPSASPPLPPSTPSPSRPRSFRRSPSFSSSSSSSPSSSDHPQLGLELTSLPPPPASANYGPLSFHPDTIVAEIQAGHPDNSDNPSSNPRGDPSSNPSYISQGGTPAGAALSNRILHRQNTTSSSTVTANRRPPRRRPPARVTDDPLNPTPPGTAANTADSPPGITAVVSGLYIYMKSVNFQCR